MRALRKRLAQVDPSAAGRAADHADRLPDGEFVALYRAMGSELDTDALAVALEAAGRHLCLPVVLERDASMIFRAWSPGEPLELDAFVAFVNALGPQKARRVSKLDVAFEKQLSKKP